MLSKSLQSCPTLYDPIDCTCQAPLSIGFSRQEYWSELPCPPPLMLYIIPNIPSCAVLSSVWLFAILWWSLKRGLIPSPLPASSIKSKLRPSYLSLMGHGQDQLNAIYLSLCDAPVLPLQILSLTVHFGFLYFWHDHFSSLCCCYSIF